MARKKTAGPEKAEPAGDIDLKAAYKYDPAELSTEITVSRYSNLAYIQVSPRDVCIDFLEMPGIRKAGKMVVGGARIYMSHDSARKLAETLGGVLEKARKGPFGKEKRG
jgi:hypothetical protein